MDHNGKPFMTRRTRKRYDKAWALTNVAVDRGADTSVAIVLAAKICKVSPKYLLRLLAMRRNEKLKGGAQRPGWI